MRLPIYNPYPPTTTPPSEGEPTTTTADDDGEWNLDDVIELA